MLKSECGKRAVPWSKFDNLWIRIKYCCANWIVSVCLRNIVISSNFIVSIVASKSPLSEKFFANFAVVLLVKREFRQNLHSTADFMRSSAVYWFMGNYWQVCCWVRGNGIYSSLFFTSLPKRIFFLNYSPYLKSFRMRSGKKESISWSLIIFNTRRSDAACARNGFCSCEGAFPLIMAFAKAGNWTSKKWWWSLMALNYILIL